MAAVLLAIDASSELAGLALYDGAVRAELNWQAGRRHSVQLVPQIERLLDLVGTEPAALSGIAAALGPGSFTGVRVGLAVAQGLAVALGLPQYGVCTLDVVAAGQEASTLPVRALVHVGRGRFATALYRPTGERLERAGEIVGVSLEELADLVDESCLLCGELDVTSRERLRGMLGVRARIASPAAGVRRAGVLAQLAWEGRTDHRHPSRLEPLYLSR